MRVLERGFSALILGTTSVFGSDILFTTVRVNTAICSPTGGSGNNTNGNGNGGNSTNLVIVDPVSTDFGTYSFKGFYPIPNQGSILKLAVGKSETSNALTSVACGDFCQGAAYFNIQNGNQCFCGNDPPVGTSIPSADPETPCAGNKTEVCGSPGFGAVYGRDGTSGGSSSGGSLTSTGNSGPVTVVVTGTVIDTAGTHTFTSTEVVSSTTTTMESDTVTLSLSSETSTSYYMGLSIPSTFSLPTATISNDNSSGSATDTTTAPGSESTQSQTYTTNGSICFGLSCVPESVTGRSGTDSATTDSPSSTTASPSSDTAGSSSAAASSSSSAGASSSSAGASLSSSAGASSSSSAGVSSSAATSSSSANGGISSSTSTSASAPSNTDPAYPCPTLDGQEYTDTSGIAYDILCNTNFLGLPSPNDLPATDARTFAECIANCDAYVPNPNTAGGAGCVAVTFGVGGTSSCYLKFAVTDEQGNSDGYDSAKLVSYNAPIVSSSIATSSTTGSGQSSAGGSSASSSKTTSSSASSSGSSTHSTSSSNGVSSSSATSSTSKASSSSSSSSSSSPASSTSSSSSTSSKITSASSSSSPPAATTSSTSTTSTTHTGSSSYTFGPEQTEITVPSCGGATTSNNTVYTDIFGYPYYVKCDVQIVGDNAYAAHADTFPKCLEYCDLLVGCAAVTYLDNAASTDSNCYPYSSFRGYSSGATGIYSGVPQNGTGDGAIQATPNLCAAGASGYNQSTYNDYFGNEYFIGCDQNVAGTGTNGGQDLKATVADTLLGCLMYCSIYNTCVGVDFTGFPVQQNAANCYPKFATGATTYAPGTQLAYLFSATTTA